MYSHQSHACEIIQYKCACMYFLNGNISHVDRFIMFLFATREIITGNTCTTLHPYLQDIRQNISARFGRYLLANSSLTAPCDSHEMVM